MKNIGSYTYLLSRAMDKMDNSFTSVAFYKQARIEGVPQDFLNCGYARGFLASKAKHMGGRNWKRLFEKDLEQDQIEEATKTLSKHSVVYNEPVENNPEELTEQKIESLIEVAIKILKNEGYKVMRPIVTEWQEV